MTDAISYHVFKTGPNGQMWLGDSENEWTRDFHSAASFNSATLAKEIADREITDECECAWVFALLPA